MIFSLAGSRSPGRRARTGTSLRLRSGFDPPDLDTPGRLPHQQGLCAARLDYQDSDDLSLRVSPSLTPIGGPGHGTRGLRPTGRRAFGLWRIRFPPVLVRTGRPLVTVSGLAPY